MNKLLLIAAIALTVSCKKEDDKPSIPSSFYGTYTGHATCQPSGSYSTKISVNERSNETVWLGFTQSIIAGETLIGKVSGNSITVEQQNNIFGSGTFSGDQLTLNLTIGSYYCTYITSK